MRVLIADRGTGEPISLGAALLAGKKVGPDATKLLEGDHRIVLSWFEWYGQATEPAIKLRVARSLCKALRAHMAAEEEIFYPAAKIQTRDDDLVQRAIEDHKGARGLIERIEKSALAGEADVELMSELQDEITAHIEEEETELFLKVRDSGMDLYAVGRAVAARRIDALFNLTAIERVNALPRADAPKVRQPKGSKAKPQPQSEKTKHSEPLKEFPVMQISRDEARDQFVLGLKNAHATVKEGQTMVKAQLSRLAQYPKLEQKMQSHLKEKEQQLQRLESILKNCGESPSKMKDAAMTVMGGAGSMVNSAAGDEVVKNSFATLGLAKMEAAAFETLILFGDAAGEREALPLLQQCLSEERAMAAFIEENLRATGMRFLQLKSEGAQASH